MQVSTSKHWKVILTLAGALAFVVLALAPVMMSSYIVNFLMLTFMFGILAVSWDIIGGMTGYVNFAISGFFGIGAYGTGVLMSKLGFGLFPSLIGGVLVAIIISIIVGPILLRLSGHYFVVASFALSELIREIIANLTAVTGGGMGLGLPIHPGSPESRTYFFYYVMGFAFVFAIAARLSIHWSRLSLAFRAIRESEIGAQVSGVNTTFYKSLSFTISSLLAAVAGGIYAYWVTYLEPVPIINLHFSITAMIMVLIGGAGTIIGPLIGTLILSIIMETAWH